MERKDGSKIAIPTVGRIIHFFPTPEHTAVTTNGNSGPVAGIVTQVFHNPESLMVNATVFPDFGTPHTIGSTYHITKVPVNENGPVRPFWIYAHETLQDYTGAEPETSL